MKSARKKKKVCGIRKKKESLIYNFEKYQQFVVGKKRLKNNNQREKRSGKNKTSPKFRK